MNYRALLAFISLLSFSRASAQVISTIAGTGVKGFAGNSELASRAELCFPTGVAVDALGVVYFADQNNNRVRKINTQGLISTVAGADSAGFSGDGHLAVSARLNAPTGVAVDTSGNLFIADFGNNRIRKVDTKGVITTYAGSGREGYLGDGCSAIVAQLNGPISVATDLRGNLYIADQGNNSIRKVNQYQVISTIGGTRKDGHIRRGVAATTAEISMPTSVATDRFGNVYVADAVNGMVHKIDTRGIIDVVAGNGKNGFCGDGGPATDACLFLPWSVAADDSGNLFIADQNNFRVRKVNNTGIISTYAGRGSVGYSGDGGCANTAELGYPWGLALDRKGGLYISDWGLNCIRKVSATPCHYVPSAASKKYDLNPVPSDDRIDIFQAKPVDDTATIALIDAAGKAVYQGKLEFRSGHALLQTATFAAGIYIVEITDAKGEKDSFRVYLEN